MSPAFFPSLHRAVDAAAAAGQLAGIACEALLEKLAPSPAGDEREQASVFRTGGQTKQYGPRARIATARPLADWERELLQPEPPLTGDELVAVRQLIEERFPISTASVNGEASATVRGPLAGVSPAAGAAPLSGAAAGPPIIVDPGRLNDAATLLIAYSKGVPRLPDEISEMRSLAIRLDEYAAAIRDYDQSQ